MDSEGVIGMKLTKFYNIQIDLKNEYIFLWGKNYYGIRINVSDNMIYRVDYLEIDDDYINKRRVDLLNSANDKNIKNKYYDVYIIGNGVISFSKNFDTETGFGADYINRCYMSYSELIIKKLLE